MFRCGFNSKISLVSKRTQAAFFNRIAATSNSTTGPMVPSPKQTLHQNFSTSPRNHFQHRNQEENSYSSNHHHWYNTWHQASLALASFSAVSLAVALWYKFNLSHAHDGFIFADKREKTPGSTLLHDSGIEEDSQPMIYRICLTGGPSSGKSTSVELLREKLLGLGYQVYIVTEIATLLLLGGAVYRPDMDIDELLAFEAALMSTQMAVEDSYIRLAKASKKPTVILCDRGVLDAKAYMSNEVFEMMLDQYGWNETKLREARYDAVIHLVTAAIGARQFYTTENNPARMETAEQAAELDMKLRQSYIGHPQLFIVDNSTNFEEKVERVYSYVGSVVGLPKTISEKRKFLLKRDVKPDEFPPHLRYELHEMTQSFLQENDPDSQTRVRKRSQKGTHTYSMSFKQVSNDGTEETVSIRPISAKSYYELVNNRTDPTLPPVKKMIKSFVSGEYYFELAKYQLSDDDSQNPIVLQVEAPRGRLQIPEFLRYLIKREVTPERETDDHYGSYRFSQMLHEQKQL